MADSLTDKYIADLERKIRERNQSKSPSLNQPQQQGVSLYEQLSSEFVQEPDIVNNKKSGALHGVGALMWNALDSALIGVPGLAYEKATGEDRPYRLAIEGESDVEGLATFGAAVGQAAGFLVPMGWIGKGARAVVSATNKVGTARMIGHASTKGAQAAKGFGLSKEVAQKAISKGLNDSKLKGPIGPLSKYELSFEKMDEVQGTVRSSIFDSMAREFGADSPNKVRELHKIADVATNALKDNGVHINNVSKVVEKALNSTFSVSNQSKLTSYVARAAEQAVTFGTYNLLYDGFQSIAGEKDFDPAGDVTSALIFSSILPAIDLVGGGGKVHVMRQAKNLFKATRDIKKRVRTGFYDDLSEKEVNGLLKILSKDNYLEDTLKTKATSYVSNTDTMMPKKKALKALKEIYAKADIDSMWGAFRKEAKDDFTASIGRMFVGGLVFDLNVMLDFNLIRALPGDEILSHMLVGAAMSKIHRPLYNEPFPNLSNFDKRVRALEYFGLDAKSMEHYGMAFGTDVDLGATYSGLLENENVKQIENIFETDEHRQQQTGKNKEGEQVDVGKPIADRDNITRKHQLALYGHELYRMVALTRNISDARADDSHIRLENLTENQIANISSKLSEIDVFINKKSQDDGKTEKLSIHNFDDFQEYTSGVALENIGIEHLKAIKDIADFDGMNLKYEPVDAFSIDKPFRLGSLDDVIASLKNTNPENLSLHRLNNIITELKRVNLIETYKETSDQTKKLEDIKNIENVEKYINERLQVLSDKIILTNYGENYHSMGKQYDFIDNPWLQEVQNYKNVKKRNSLFHIAEGNLNRLDPSQRDLFNILQEQFGNKVPKISEGETVRVELPTDIKDSDKKKILDPSNDDGLISVQKQLNYLARIWGTGGQKSTGDLQVAKDGVVPWEDALSIIKKFNNQGYVITKEMADYQQRWHYARILRSPHITPRHIAIIESMKESGFANLKPRDGVNSVLEIPNRNAIKGGLEQDGYKSDTKEYKDFLKKYDKSMEALQRVTGDFVQVESKIQLDQFKDIASSINEMYRSTFAFDEQFINEYKEVVESNQFNIKQLSDLQSIVDKLYVDVDKKERNPVDNKELHDDLILKINKVLKDPPSGMDKNFVENIENLRRNIGDEFQGEQTLRGVTTVGKTLQNIINDYVPQYMAQNRALDNILFNSESFSTDRMQFVPRNDRMIKRLIDYLNKNFDVVMPEAPSFKQIIDEYNRHGKTSEVTKKLVNHLEVWERGYNETEYFKSQAEEQARFGDPSTLFSKKQQDVSPSNISARYERYNENLRHDNFRELTEAHYENHRLSLFAETPADRKMYRKAAEESRDNIRDEVESAIYEKHGVEIGVNEKDIPSKLKDELESFRKNTYLPLILQQMGREMVPTFKIYQDSDGAGLEMSKTFVGNGLLADFRKRMRQIDNEGVMGKDGFDIVMLENTGVWKGNKINVNQIKNIQELINEAVITTESYNAVKQGLQGKADEAQAAFEHNKYVDNSTFQNPVKVSVSHNVSLIVSKGQLQDGRLNRQFKNWYDNKIELLKKNKPEGYERTIKHFEIIYGEFLKDIVDKDGKDVEYNTPKPDIKQMVRAMYWDSLSSDGFNNVINAANNSQTMNSLGSSFFKYVVLGEATGAKTQAQQEFLRIALEDDKKINILTDRQKEAISNYKDKDGFNLAGIGDEMDGSPLNANYIVEKALQDMVDGGQVAKDMIPKIKDVLKSLNSSSVNAQSYLGHDAASILYLHKGRDSEDAKFGTAGVKPTGWFNDGVESVLLKTNFVYDKKIADVMQKAGIDILTNQSALKSFSKDHIEITKNEVDGAWFKKRDPLGMVELALGPGKVGENNIAKMKLENLFLGKVEDQKTLTNITYALTDFMNDAGYQAYMSNFVGYEQKLKNRLGKLGDVVIGTGDRYASTNYLLNQLKEADALFENSSDGLTEMIIRAGADPNSLLVNPAIQRIAARGAINALRKPKTEGASYSVLIPYIEGSMPVYSNIDDPANRKQIIAGGKKLSHLDGQVVLDDVSKVQYLVNITKDGINRDVQIGRHKDEWTIEDPYETVVLDDLKKEIKVIKSNEDKYIGNDLKLYKIHDELANHNNTTKLKSKLFLHSLSLRMPNLGGDVAVHRVEGFYDQEQGNVVGINAFDIALIHQADFDVDMSFSYNLKPTQLSHSVYNSAGASLDAYVFPSDDFSMDFLGMGKGMARAGSGYETGDNLDTHIQNFHQSKRNFGTVKKLSTQISALMRQPDLINIPGVEMVRQKDKAEYSTFLQGYKNTLQSIIDAVKVPNWASKADASLIKKYILFGGDGISESLKIDLKGTGDNAFANDNIRRTQEEFKGFFKLDKDLPKDEKEIIKDALIEMVDVMSLPQRVLTDVWDESGRRPPDANEISHIKGELDDFYDSPNKYIYDKLIDRNFGKKDKLASIHKFYYGDVLNNLEDWRKVWKNPKQYVPKRDFININPDNIKLLKDNTVGSFIVSRFNSGQASLQGYSDKYTKPDGLASRNASKRIMQRIDDVSALSNLDTHEKIRTFLDNDENISGTFLDEYSSQLKGDQIINEKYVRQSSLMMASLKHDQRSIMHYIENANANAPSRQIERASRRLMRTEALLDHISNKQAEHIENIGKKDDFREYGVQRMKLGSYRPIKNPRLNKDTHVYRKVVRNGRTHMEYAGWIRPGGDYSFNAGEYYLLKNPVSYEAMNKREFLDGYSFLFTTGDVQIEHLFGHASKNQQDNFIEGWDSLKRTIGRMTSETFKQNKKNPYYKENWQLARYQEDAIIKNFIDKNLRFVSGSNDKGEINSTSIANLARYMMKPSIVPGKFVLADAGNIRLPSFKINQRMVKAVSRYLVENGHRDLFENIMKQYGNEYRRRLDNIMPEDTESYFKSNFTDYKDENFWRNLDNPAIELMQHTGQLYKFAHLRAHWNEPLSRKADVSKNTIDIHGNLKLIYKFGTYDQVLQKEQYEFFYEKEKSVKEKQKDCGNV